MGQSERFIVARLENNMSMREANVWHTELSFQGSGNPSAVLLS